MTTNGQTCPKCGTPLSDDALEGLCRRCLGSLAFGCSFVGEDTEVAPGRSPLRRLGDYELIEEIARGGMGVVYQARQLSLNRIVAVKVVLHGPFSSRQFVQRFRTEVEAVAGLKHPNIVPIYEVGEQDGHHYFSMEYIEGQDLAELVRTQPLPARRAAGYLATVAEAVHHAHQLGILHRDLKPSNLLLDAFDQPRITDFGLAKLLDHDEELTATGQVLGSPSYMPPEQAAGGSDTGGPTGDLYSLGAILYHLLTCRPPFQGDSVPAVLLQVQTAEPVPVCRLNPGVPRDLETICLKCLEKDPARRYANARELAEDLQRFLRDEPIRARPITPLATAWRWCRRRPLVAALAAALGLALAVGLWQTRRAEIARVTAVATRTQSRLHEYSTDVRAAWEAAERGLFADARRLLLKHRPSPGEADARGFEWRFVWHRSEGQQLATLTNHTSTVCGVAVSPDGRWLASSGMDGTLCLWELATLQLHRRWPLGDVGWFVEFSPDSSLLLSSKGTNRTAVWRLPEGTLLRELDGARASVARAVPLVAAFSVNPFLDDRPARVRISNYATGAAVRELPDPARAVALSPDGELAAVGLVNSNIVLREVATGRLLATLATAGEAFELRFSADSARLAMAGGGKRIGVWNLNRRTAFNIQHSTFNTQHSMPFASGASTSAGPSFLTTPAGTGNALSEGHWLKTWAVAFSPDGRHVATTSSDRSIRVWDAETLRPVEVFNGHGDEVWCVAWTPDSQRLVTGGKDARVMVWQTGKPRPEFALPNGDSGRPFVSSDGLRILTHPERDGQTGPALWSARGERLDRWPPGRWFLGLTPEGAAVEWDETGGTLNGWSPNDGTAPSRSARLESLAGVGGVLRSGSGLSDDGRLFFAIRADGTAGIWETASGRLRHQFNTRAMPLACARLSADGRWLALSPNHPYEAYLYDAGTGRERVLRGHTEYVKRLAFSPDDRWLATAGIDGRIKLWETATGAELHTLAGHWQNVDDVAFAPDGRTLASIETGVCLKLWRLDTLREVASIARPDAGEHLVFSPAGDRLWFLKTDGTVACLQAPPAP